MSSPSPRLLPSQPHLLEKRASRKNGEAAQCLGAIVESSEDAIIGESLDDIITSLNAGAERMFGYTREEVIGRSISILHSEVDSEERGAILELIQQGRSAKHFETKRQRKYGTHIDVSVSVSPVLAAWR